MAGLHYCAVGCADRILLIVGQIALVQGMLILKYQGFKSKMGQIITSSIGLCRLDWLKMGWISLSDEDNLYGWYRTYFSLDLGRSISVPGCSS